MEYQPGACRSSPTSRACARRRDRARVAQVLGRVNAGNRGEDEGIADGRRTVNTIKMAASAILNHVQRPLAFVMTGWRREPNRHTGNGTRSPCGRRSTASLAPLR